MAETINQPESEPVSSVEPDAVLSACKRWLALGVDPYVIARRLKKKFGPEIAQQAEIWIRRAREEMLASLNVPHEQRTAEAVCFYKYIISHPKSTISQKLRARTRIDQLIGLTPMPTPRTPGPGPGSFPAPEGYPGYERFSVPNSTPGSAPTTGGNLGTSRWGSVHAFGNPAGNFASAPGGEPRCPDVASDTERCGDDAWETVPAANPGEDEQHNDHATLAAQDRPPVTQDSANTQRRQQPDDRRDGVAAAYRLDCESSGGSSDFGGLVDFPAPRKASQGRAGGRASGGASTGGGTSGGVSRRLPTRAQRRAAAREQQKAARRAARSSGSSQPMAGPISSAHATRPVLAAHERAPP
ncbi:MAG: hypothetical protein JJU36_02410 [Phycisphaeraceae bacterium]|nr:hypothetical protein [Phycisphaeraceae bacterium]